MRLFLLLGLVFFLSLPASAQDVLFVDADATGANDGSSWADAFPDLQDALALVEAGDEVWVAEGTYLPDAATPSDRDASFTLTSGTALYGGFDGTETALDQRDVEANVTVLSGDLGVPDDLSDNAYHVVTASGVDGTTVLDGFTITAGFGNGTNPRNRGAGIYAVEGSPRIRNCQIVENRVVQTDGDGGGAGGFFTGGAPMFEHVIVARNAGTLGGGLWLFEGVEATVRDSEFVENTATNGSGVYNFRGSLSVLESVFVRNVSSRSGGGIRATGSEVYLLNVGVYGNVSSVDDGDIISLGGGVAGGDLTAVNVEFVGNVAERAAGLSADGNDNYTLTNVTFAANQSEEQGGGIRLVSGSDLWLDNAVLWGNTGGEIFQPSSGSAVLRHVLVAGGCPPEPPFGETFCDSILDTAPLFVRDPDPGPDGTWGTPDDDYGDLRLQEDSPAVDFGLAEFLPTDSFDLDADGDTAEPLPLDLVGRLRVVGKEVDLGAYERQPPVAAEPEPPVSGVSLAVYPNPAWGPVTVVVRLGRAQRVEVALLDVLGRELVVLAEGLHDAGRHEVAFDASRLASGVYVIRAEVMPTGEAVQAFTQKLTLLK